jgi:tripartite ATP-independent transporter DctM subunit
MTDIQLLILVAVVLIVAIFLGHPIALTFGGMAIIFGLAFLGPKTFPLCATKVYSTMCSFSLVAIPLFVFMAYILEASGISKVMFDGIRNLMFGLAGGLAVAVDLVCTLVAASTGIIGASIVSMGILAGPQMLRHNYDKKLTVGSIMAGGTLGILIPPSILLILMGATSGLSVGQLFMGGVGTGLLLSSMYIAYILILCYRNPTMGPPVPIEERLPLRSALVMGIKGVVPPIGMILAVLGSIFMGIATPAQAGAIGCSIAIIMMIARGQFNRRNLSSAVTDTLKTSSMVLFIIVAAGVFSAVFMGMGCGTTSGDIFAGIGNKWLFIAATMALIFFLGMIIDWTAILVLLVPIFFPIAAGYDIDLLWFGMLVAVNLQTSFLSPPFGYALFFMKSLALPGVTIGDIYRSVIPFIGLQLIGLTLVIVFPPIATYLPSIMHW